DDPVLLLHLGLTCLDMPGQLAQAKEALHRSLMLFEPKSTVRITAFLALAKAYHCSGRPQQELQTCEQAIEEFPDDATMLMHIGTLYEQRNQADRAADCYRRLLKAGKLHLSVP